VRVFIWAVLGLGVGVFWGWENICFLFWLWDVLAVAAGGLVVVSMGSVAIFDEVVLVYVGCWAGEAEVALDVVALMARFGGCGR
jgi:hypothetical protein